MTLLLRRFAALDLRAAKVVTDRVLDGDVVDVDARDAGAAEELVRELRAIGAIADVVEDPT